MFDARAARFLGVCLLVCTLGACSRTTASPRMALRGVETPLLAGDAPLELSGDALPSGAVIQLALHGVMHAPGSGDRSVDLVLPGVVLSPERLTAAGDPSLASLLGRGSFDGELEVHCTDPASACSGALDEVSFDIDGPTALSVERLRRAAQGLLASFALELADDAPRSNGLVIARATRGGLAARAGLRTGDVIEAANGVRIHALGDLAPVATASVAQLRVRSAGGERRTLELPLSAAAPFHDAQLVGLYALACPILLLLLWVAPWPTPGELLSRWLGAVRELRQRESFGASKLEVVLPCALAGATALLAERLDVFAVLLVHLALVMAVCARRTTRWSAVLGHLAAIWLCVGAVAALSSTRSWSGLLLEQGALPWEWNLFARPPLALAALICVWHAARLPKAFANESAAAPRARTARALELFAHSLLAVLFAALFLGGSRTAGGPGLEALALGSALAAAKSLLVFGLIAASGRMPRRVSAAVLGALFAFGGFWLWLAPSRSFELALGAGVCTFLALALLLALLERRSASSALQTRTAQLG
jgi:hypothetical protein